MSVWLIFYKGLAAEDLAYCNPSSLVWRFWFARRFVVAVFPPQIWFLVAIKTRWCPPICPLQVSRTDHTHEPEATRLRAEFRGSFLVPPLRTHLSKTFSSPLHMPHVENLHLFFALQLPVPFVGTLFFQSLIEFLLKKDIVHDLKHPKIYLHSCSYMKIICPLQYPSATFEDRHFFVPLAL